MEEQDSPHIRRPPAPEPDAPPPDGGDGALLAAPPDPPPPDLPPAQQPDIIMEAMSEDFWTGHYATARQVLDQTLMNPALLIQGCVILAAFLFALVIAPRLRPRPAEGGKAETEAGTGPMPRLAVVFRRLLFPLVWAALTGGYVIFAGIKGLPDDLAEIALSLIGAWIAIRLLTLPVREAAWARLISASVWVIAALMITGTLRDTIDFLATRAVLKVGPDITLSAYGVIKGVLTLAVLMWLAGLLSRLSERRIGNLPNLSPSIQVLFTKLLKIFFFTVAILAGLSTVGIDLTALAVFSGAVGFGVGFGLQKVFSNLISGMILLMDRSIKPGDVITVGGTHYGRVSNLGARYASVVTRDGLEYLIPNETLITQEVINWTYSHSAVRLRIPFGVSYESDLDQVIELAHEAARDTRRVIANPAPNCLLQAFGESSVDFELRIWISDPKNGISNVKSDVMLALWRRLREAGVKIPYPQRDLHLVSATGEVRSILTGAKG